MNTLHPYIDQNHQLPIAAPPMMPGENEHEVRCGMCAREISIDDETYSLGNKAIESGLDNPFRCDVCAEEYDDLAYEG